MHLGRGDQTIDAPTDSEIGYGATAGRDGLWATVLERAYAQERHGDSTDGHAYDSIDGAQPASEGIEAVTGNSANTDDLSFTRLDTTRDRLESATADGRATTAQIRPSMPFTDGRRDNGLPMGHIYTVTGYDREHDTVTLRNPWGHTEPRGEGGGAADGTDDGFFTMPLSQFDENFTTVAYEER